MKELPNTIKQFQHEVSVFANGVDLTALALVIFGWDYSPGFNDEDDEWHKPRLTVMHKVTPEAVIELNKMANASDVEVHVTFLNDAQVPVFRHEFTVEDLSIVPVGCSSDSTESAEGYLTWAIDSRIFYTEVPSAPLKDKV
jgi:hypothetical protein